MIPKAAVVGDGGPGLAIYSKVVGWSREATFSIPTAIEAIFG
jgi:hypothetical protein